MKWPWLYIILLDPLCFATQGNSKYIQTEVVSLLVDWSLGQSMITPVLDKGHPIMISSGFLQSKNCDRCIYKTLDSFLLPLKIGPNPVEQVLQIKLKQAGVVWEAAEIYTTEGLLIYRTKPSLAGLNLHYTIPFSQYPKGLYFLKVYFLVDEQYAVSKTFQIYKL